MSGRSVLNGLLGLLAVVALGFGAVLAAAPTVLPAEVVELVATVERAVDADRVLLAMGGVVGLFALWRSYFSGASAARDRGVSVESDRNRTQGRDGRTRRDRRRNRTPSRTRQTGTNATSVEVVGKETTERVSQTIRALKRGEARTEQADAVVEDLRRSLRAIETAHGRSDRADERIRRGEWTDDRIAATFLGDESAGRLSIWHRLRTWLFPGRTFERRLERTLDELDRYATEFDATATTARDRDGESDEESGEERDGERGEKRDRESDEDGDERAAKARERDDDEDEDGDESASENENGTERTDETGDEPDREDAATVTEGTRV